MSTTKKKSTNNTTSKKGKSSGNKGLSFGKIFTTLIILAILYFANEYLLSDDDSEQAAVNTSEQVEDTPPPSNNNAKPNSHHNNTDKDKNNNGNKVKPNKPTKPNNINNQSAGILMLEPKTNSKVEEQIIEHIGYTTSYNKNLGIPNWVVYVLTKGELKSVCEREGEFMADPDAKGKKISTYDYTGSGYDRGHMAPAADMKWGNQAMNESFYLSNVCPQSPKLNRGRWLNLENKSRDWARAYDSVMVVCGPIFTKKTHKTIGQNEIAVPDSFFKIIARVKKGKYYVIGFIFPNSNCTKNLEYYAVSVDDIESATGHNFFESFPDDLENELESQVNISDWL